MRDKLLKACRILIPAYLKARIRARPIWAHFYVTRRCNLKCSYCFVREEHKPDSETDKAVNVIDKLHSLGCRLVAFLGGEPTMRSDLSLLIAHASKHKMITHVSTNGTLLTRSYLSVLCDSGLDVLNLSVDSISATLHSRKDLEQNMTIFDNILLARQERGLDVNVNCVLTRRNADKVVAIVDRMTDLKIPISIGYIIKNTYSDKLQDPALFFTTEEERNLLFSTLATLKRMKKEGYSIIEPARYFDDVEKFARGNSSWYCAAGLYYLSVDCDGRLMMCGSLPAEEQSIMDIDRNYFKTFRNRWQAHLQRCKPRCISNCVYDTSFFIQHPLKFFAGELRNHTRPKARVFAPIR